MFDISKKSPLFDYFAPKGNIKGLLSIPHSGETIPEEFQTYIEGSDIDLMQDLDFRVHELVNIKSLIASSPLVLLDLGLWLRPPQPSQRLAPRDWWMDRL